MRTRRIRAAIGMLVLSAMAAVYLFWSWNHPLQPGREIYAVKPGMTLRAFARELSGRGVLPESHSFVWLAYLTGHQRDLKSGEYLFRNGMTARELLEQIVAGRVVEYPVVLVEGWTFRQFLDAIGEGPKLTHPLIALSPRARVERPGDEG